MLTYLYECSRGRSAWFLLMISALALDGIALFFQHGMGLQPCVMCIYERIAVLGIAFAGFLGWIAPRSVIIRWLAVALWIYSGIAGLQLSREHTMIQLYPSPFNTCDFFVNFPEWLPLNTWLPSVFEASGDCAVQQWVFLKLDMPQWLIGIFAVYLLISALVLLSQFIHRKQPRRLF
ncbi:disulfide bond formation protein DsbB [Morganella morganii]|uniref:disulfide bond formation protein DsbB n=1 Tax=Morganella morganii TaxID=582 RepID=UPI00129952F9|nr:disulfide bond formation protein DsbB [Morganella morganii]MRE58801.1 disulfide bond formation protein DsbB [Morganella morganii]